MNKLLQNIFIITNSKDYAADEERYYFFSLIFSLSLVLDVDSVWVAHSFQKWLLTVDFTLRESLWKISQLLWTFMIKQKNC